MHIWIITFFLGVCTLALCAELPSLYWLLALPLVFSLQFLKKLRLKPTASNFYFKIIINHIGIFTIGFCWALVYTYYIASWSLPADLESKKILITGYISSIPVYKSHYISFEFKTNTINNNKVSTKLRLNWYNNAQKKLNAGDKWQLLVRLKRPHGTANPGGFDLEKHLLVHHIRATGYVVNNELNKILNARLNAGWYRCPLTKLRQHLLIKMESILRFDELAPIIIALITGSEHTITKTQWEVMRNTGTSYLVAISGLHIGLVAAIVLVAVQFLWRRSKKLPLILPAREAGIIAGLFVGFIYGAISGFSIPTQRALIMLVTFSLATLMRRNTGSWNAWLWSLFLVLIIDPLAELTIGFWLSFSAVAAIIYASGFRIYNNKLGHLARFWRMQLIVTIALLPLTLLFFQQVSLTTFVANFIAMPGVCLIVVPISLLGAICLLFSNYAGGLILYFGSKLLHLVWWWLTLVSNFSYGSWYHPIYNSWILISASIGVILLFAPRGFPAKYFGIIWFLPLFFYAPAKPKTNEVWFTLLDVGQGLAAVVQTANHILLYDTGPKFFDNDVGATIIIPYLRIKGMTHIDTMVISHGDLDHSGGADSIIKALKVKNILTSVPDKFSHSCMCIAGQSWNWDGVDFQVLSPPKDTQLTGNEASCVLKISQGTKSILLVGDIERAAEELLINNYATGLKSAILVAPHHGSATSSTQGLVDFVDPKYVLFPVGYKNRFHFPNRKTVIKYAEIGAILLDTAQEGAITFKFDDKSDILPPPISYRKQKRHFWNY